MDEATNNQRILDNHGSVTQNGDIIENQTNIVNNSKFEKSTYVNHKNININNKINNFSFKINILEKYKAKDLNYLQYLFQFSVKTLFFSGLIISISLFFYFINPNDLNLSLYSILSSFGLFLILVIFLLSTNMIWNSNSFKKYSESFENFSKKFKSEKMKIKVTEKDKI